MNAKVMVEFVDAETGKAYHYDDPFSADKKRIVELSEAGLIKVVCNIKDTKDNTKGQNDKDVKDTKDNTKGQNDKDVKDKEELTK